MSFLGISSFNTIKSSNSQQKTKKTYVTNATQAQEDRVELTTKKQESKVKKFAKYASALGVLGSIIAAIFIGKNNSSQTPQQQTNTSTSTPTPKEIQETENKRRIKERNDRLKAEAERHKAEAERIKAEQEAKIKAEKEAEIQKLETENKLSKEKADKIRDQFNEEFLNGGEITIDALNFFQGGDKIYKHTSEEFFDEIISQVKNAEKDGVKEEHVKNMYEQITNGTKSTTYTYKKSKIHKFTADHMLEARKNILNEFEKIKSTTPQNENESFGEYLSRVNDIRKAEKAKQPTEVEKIRAKLHYDDTTTEKVELTDEEMERLKKWRPQMFEGKTKEEALKQIKALRQDYTNLHTGSYTNAYSGVDDIMINKAYDRYDSNAFYKQYNLTPEDYEVEPLYRWMNINYDQCNSIYYELADKGPDGFVNDLYKEGEIFTAPTKQCCSKNKAYAETYFSDSNPDMTVKWVIHPKGRVSKAADIGEGKYGAMEAVYAEGTKFKILGKHLEEYVNPNYVEGSIVNGNRVFFRWIVDVQEV